jgi:hypothetical protein
MIPKAQSKAVNRRRTENTMTKRKKTNRQIMTDKILPRKLNIEQHEPNKKLEVNSSAPAGIAVPTTLVKNHQERNTTLSITLHGIILKFCYCANVTIRNTKS